MRGFGVLLKKELREHMKTHRLLIVMAVFLLLGMGTPLMLHFLPSIISSTGETAITLPEFTAADAAINFFDSVAQIGMVVVILVSMGAIARERERGTAVITLSKPVSRVAFVAAKFAALAMIFGTGLAVGAMFCYIYTVVLFGGIGAAGFIIAALLNGLFLSVCISITLLCSSIFKSATAAGGLALVIIVALWALSAIPGIGSYAPMGILNWGNGLVAGTGAGAWGSLIVSLLLSFAFVSGAWQALVRKEL